MDNHAVSYTYLSTFMYILLKLLNSNIEASTRKYSFKQDAKITLFP